MARSKPTRSRAADLLGLLIVGIGVGWLVGMSTSPVVSIVVSSVTATAAAVIAVLSGLEVPRSLEIAGPDDGPARVPKRVRVGPLAALVAGVVLGAAIGLTSRSAGVFGTDLDAEINKWTKHGFSEQVVTDALFAAAYPLPGSSAIPNRLWSDERTGVLFDAPGDLASVCTSLLSLDSAALRKYAQGSSLNGVRQIAEAVEDPAALKAVLEVICPAE